MPILHIGPKLVYFAHIPKCAGSAVEDYLTDRFGPLGLLDRQYLSIPEDVRWSRTSPQHIDWTSLTRILPETFFADVFAVVRHPLARAVSAYRFQSEIERSVPEGQGFSAWLEQEVEDRRRDPHRSDNHSRAQSDFLPPADGLPCAVFHLEHGLDALIPYFDMLAGDQGGPRAIMHTNASDGRAVQKVTPTAKDVALVAEVYAEDFRRFGYDPETPKPLAPPPALDAALLAEAARARTQAQRPINRLMTRARRRLRRHLN